jgi:glycine/serine hydroxymethyltransferase
MLVDLRKFKTTGRDMEKLLDTVYITANKNKIPNDRKTPLTSGIRLGSRPSQAAFQGGGYEEGRRTHLPDGVRLHEQSGLHPRRGQ